MPETSSTSTILSATNSTINSANSVVINVPNAPQPNQQPQRDFTGRTIICGKSLAAFMLLVWGVYTKYVYDDIENQEATPTSIGIYAGASLLVFFLAVKGCLAPCTDRRPDDEDDGHYNVLPANTPH